MGRFKLAFTLTVFAGAAAAALSGRWPWRRLEVPAPTPALAAVVPTLHLTSDTLRRGETVSHLFARNGIPDLDLRAVKDEAALDPRRLRAGLVFSFESPNPDSAPVVVRVRTGPERRVTFRRVAAGWDAESQTIEWTPEVVRIEGAIDNSLYEALDAQVADSQLDGDDRVRLAWELADVYAWQVDFTRDIQPGDRFQVLVERLVSEDGDVRLGRILATDLSISGKALTAFRFQGASGPPTFYDDEGKSLRRAFLRAPVQFRRISSNFSRTRAHPVLGRTRRHQGTDYAAVPGTPVMAAGDGVVLRAGRAGGYGNLVELRHRNGVTTRYAHLQGFAKRTRGGARVQQGQVIGYVGSTGLSSGPHLHYEFRIKGTAVDSRRVKLGHGAPIAEKDRAAFEAARAQLSEQLYRNPPRLVALHTN